MIGIGIDLGASSTKGAAIRVLNDGTIALLEAVVVPSNELKNRSGDLASALARHRASVFSSRPRLCMCVSHPDVVFERTQLKLDPATGAITEEDIRSQLTGGKLPLPGGTKALEDLWDFQLLKLLRRTDDVEKLGGKSAEGLFARVPRAVADSGIPGFKPLTSRGLEPAAAAATNAFLKFTESSKSGRIMLLILGANQAQAILIDAGVVVRTVTAPIVDLVPTVEKTARLAPEQAAVRLRTADLSAEDPVSMAIQGVVAKTMEEIQGAIFAEDGSAPPAPEKIILCGGIGSLKGMGPFINSILGLDTETMAQPPQLQASMNLPAPFPIFAGAIGAALRAAGAAPLTLMPKMHVAVPIAVKEEKPEPAQPQAVRPGSAAGARSGDALAGITGPIRRGFRRFMRVTDRFGWAWLGVGLAAIVAIVPVIYTISSMSRERAELNRELALQAPATLELQRQNALIREYVSLTGSGGLSLLPWGTVITEMAGCMPTGTYITSLSANSDRVLIHGRVQGRPGTRVRQIIRRLKKAPILKRHGLTPPAL